MVLATKLLSDKLAGIITDAAGRRYFRSRRVTFQTIKININELLESGWLGFETELAPLDWQTNPSHLDIRNFSLVASERFLAFWYRVFDVAVARALAGNGKEIFQMPLFHSSSLTDIGIPEEAEYSSVHPFLHEKIISEYKLGRDKEMKYRIYYLSNYLTGVNADIINQLHPYQRLWEQKSNRRLFMSEIKFIHAGLATLLFPPEQKEMESPGALLYTFLDSAFQAILKAVNPQQVKSDSLRKLISKCKVGEIFILKAHERREIIRNRKLLNLSDPLCNLYTTLQLPDVFYEKANSTALMSTSAYRTALRLSRFNYLHRQRDDNINAASLEIQLKNYLTSFKEKLKALSPETLELNRPTYIALFTSIHIFKELMQAGADKTTLNRCLTEWGSFKKEKDISGPGLKAQNDFETLCSFFDILTKLKKAENEIISIYKGYEKTAPLPADIHVESNGTESDFAYEPLIVPAECQIGNPHHELLIMNSARKVLTRRLRPIRRTTSFYSLIPDHRHGAMTLNPIMKLWKDKPGYDNKEQPAITRLEINTKDTIACLIELARLADSKLEQYIVARGRIIRMKRCKETIDNANFFLLPGSCFPIREIHRLDFPEFRGMVIGETRSPVELGVPHDETSVLTGGWYQKANHSFYYPVGGDNGRLLQVIWRSGRFPGPPAFFFALGQFVYDCQADELVYYRRHSKTFRECIEEYYRMEDRIRKNRGEKFGRRKPDNSRNGIRFMFAVAYARLIMEVLTGSSQSHFRHKPTEMWLNRVLELPLLMQSNRAFLENIRREAREIISSSR